MKPVVSGMAARLLLGAGLVFGTAPLFAAVQPAFSQEGGHSGGKSGEATSSTTHTGDSHTTSGESTHSTTEHTEQGCSGGWSGGP